MSEFLYCAAFAPVPDGYEMITSAEEGALWARETTWPLQTADHPFAHTLALASEQMPSLAATGAALAGGGGAAALAALLRGLNGHFALITVSEGWITVATDCGGSVPVYHGTMTDGTPVIGTNVNDVASVVGAARDDASVADMLVSGSIVHPFTWFRGVEVLDPACVTRLRRGRAPERQPYWSPGGETFLSSDEAAEALGATMIETAGAAVAGADAAALLYSGGDDARTVAASLPRDLPKTGYVFLEERNRELFLARLHGRLLGVDVRMLERRDGFYLDRLAEKQAVVGLGISLAHAHSYGFGDALPKGPVLGGWTADTLFKGYYLTKALYAGGAITTPSTRKVVRDLAAGPYAAELKARYAARYEALLPLGGPLAYELLRCWPLSVHQHYGNFAASRRVCRMTEPFMASRMVQLSRRVSPLDKLDSTFFGRAFGKRLGLAGYVPKSTGSIMRLGARGNARVQPLAAKALEFYGNHFTRARKQGSWPNMLGFNSSFRRALAPTVEAALIDFGVDWLGAQALGNRVNLRRDNDLTLFLLYEVGFALSG